MIVKYANSLTLNNNFVLPQENFADVWLVEPFFKTFGQNDQLLQKKDHVQ